MESLFVEQKSFDKLNYVESPLPKGEYEDCKFVNCDFSNSSLIDSKFSDCEFINCNLSLVKLSKTALRDIKFKDCKMLGLQFDTCNQFGFAIHFENCNLTHSSFYQCKNKKANFKNSQLNEVDFTDADLSGSVFDNCDMNGTKFENTILEKADLCSSYNYSIDPEMNRIKKAKFSSSGLAGLLDKYDIEIE